VSFTQKDLDHAAALYRRTYDRLYIDSMRAGSKDECDKIDAALRVATERYDAAKAAFAAARGEAQ
jgi:hypothetical protein